ncbi:MAG: FixH family protein [Proteobacteria bacterium]|jgi:hypothetical protein|nr:FixH family protein [Pseudomonadota bacterium]
MAISQPASPPAAPWWKVGSMWLVVGGPLIVVVASFITLYLAISRPDYVYTDASRPTSQAQQSAHERGSSTEPLPALQARNHAATGGVTGSATRATPATATRP